MSITRTHLWVPTGSDWPTNSEKSPLFELTRSVLTAFNLPGPTRYYNPHLGAEDPMMRTDQASHDGKQDSHISAILLPDHRDDRLPLFQDTVKAVWYAKGRKQFVDFVFVALPAYMSYERLGELTSFCSGRRADGDRNVTMVTCAHDWSIFMQQYCADHPYVES